MSTAIEPRKRVPKPTPDTPQVPPLINGDHLDQKMFHERYEAMPPETRAELIGGIVYIMSSPLKHNHGLSHGRLVQYLFDCMDATPGVEANDNATTIMGLKSEPQPDGSLRVLPECGGQTRLENGYLVGAPELLAEVALATESIDLHSKKKDYEKAGVKEYIVLALRQHQVYWFVLRDGKFEELAAGADGIYRSEVFPGLWLDPVAVLEQNRLRLREVLQQGLASPEHAAFVARLAAARKGA